MRLSLTLISRNEDAPTGNATRFTPPGICRQTAAGPNFSRSAQARNSSSIELHCDEAAAESTSPIPERAESTFFQTSQSEETSLNLRNKGSQGERSCIAAFNQPPWRTS